MKELDYYIASGFFDPESLNEVIRLENSYDEKGFSYFSPRSITMDLSPNNPDREKNAGILFNKDIEMIHRCRNMIATLDNNLDKGTLFEVGYMAALILWGVRVKNNLYFNFPKGELEGFDQFLDKIFEFSIENSYYLGKLHNDHSYVLLVDENHYNDLNLIKNFYNINADVLSIDQDPVDILIKIRSGNTPIIVTDEVKGQRSFKLYVFMGLLKGLIIPFYTASIKDYGSNIMIASSTEGHLNLPSIVNPYKSKLVIE